MSKRPTPTDRPSATDADTDDAFLSRWARRKGVARRGGDPDAERPAPPEAKAEQAEAGAPEAAELSDADMPPLESIDHETDMSGFFSPKVSAAVKKAALRKFFHSSAFNFTDGLDDYDDDFRTFAELGDIVTSDMRGRAELEARRAKEALEARSGEPATADTRAETPAEEPIEEAGEDQETVEQTIARAPGEGEGITRDPARPGGIARGKLVPRDAAPDEDAEDDDVGEGEDEA